METQNKEVYNIIIIDESGSMNDLKHSVVSGFNEIVQTIKLCQKNNPEQKHFVSLVTFNSDKVNTLKFNELAETIEPMNSGMYNPNYQTPLYDAVGSVCIKTKVHLLGKSNYNVLVTIITDGLENNSKEFNLKQIKALITELENEHWTFAYIGTTHDVFKASTEISISNSLSFSKTSHGFQDMIAKDRKSRIEFNAKIRTNSDFRNQKYFVED